MIRLRGFPCARYASTRSIQSLWMPVSMDLQLDTTPCTVTDDLSGHSLVFGQLERSPYEKEDFPTHLSHAIKHHNGIRLAGSDPIRTVRHRIVRLASG